jgi:FkbM family methyltransferase
MVISAAQMRALHADPELAALRGSLEFYHANPEHDAAMDRLYERFVGPGDLVFDIGAHVGDRVGSFRRLGARVVAVEPQPACLRALRAIYGRDPEVTLVPAVCGARPGRLTMYLNSANTTVSTVSPQFVEAARGAGGWEGQVWDGRMEAPCVTLDALIAEHGAPAFANIDVEGFEDAVLAGLSTPLPALSFEFTTIQRPVAQRCLDRLVSLGFDGYDFARGETMTMTFGRWVPAGRMSEFLAGLPHEANAGDVYCRSAPPARP